MVPSIHDSQEMAGIEEDDRPDLLPPPEAAAKPKKSVSPAVRSNMFLVGLFMAGLATVYGLSLRKGPATASADVKHAEQEVDGAILRFAAAAKPGAPQPGAVTRDLIQGFYRHNSQEQVAVEKLSKNPFLFVAPRISVVETAPAKAESAEKTPEQETLERAQLEFKTLYLQSVMMGRNGGSAIISNNLLTVGQRIKCFTVTTITPKSVTLTWQDREFSLFMQ